MRSLLFITILLALLAVWVPTAEGIAPHVLRALQSAARNHTSAHPNHARHSRHSSPTHPKQHDSSVQGPEAYAPFGLSVTGMPWDTVGPSWEFQRESQEGMDESSRLD
jgi:hypothetical protein